MSDLRRLSAGSVAIRDASDGDGRTVEGYAYRWGELTDGAEEFPGMLEGFAPGAFSAAIAARGERSTVFLDRHGRSVIGGVRFAEDDTGLRFTGRLMDSPAAREYAESVAHGNDGVSLEFMLRGAKSKRQGKTILHESIPVIAALAGEYAPAYQGASVALRRDGGQEDMTEETTPEVPAVKVLTPEQVSGLATEAATEVMRTYAERGAFRGEVDPLLQYGSIGELVYAAAREDSDRDALGRPTGPLKTHAARAIARIARRALDDTTFNSGANAALANGNLVTSELQRLVNRGRPAITAFGGPRSIGDIAGLTLNWPYFDGTLSDFVAAQSAEKAAIISASVDIKLGTEALVTYAGGTDISYQVLRRGTPSILDMYARIWLAAWAAVTDAAFVTELESGSVTVDYAEALSAHDLAEFTANFITASLAVEAATGQPAQFVLASTTAFTRLANLIAPSATDIAAASNMDLRGLAIGVGNLPIIHVAGITADKVIVSNELAAAWYEDGPFLASDDDVEKLGRNVAYWSLGAGARFIPAGIVEIYDVTP